MGVNPRGRGPGSLPPARDDLRLPQTGAGCCHQPFFLGLVASALLPWASLARHQKARQAVACRADV